MDRTGRIVKILIHLFFVFLFLKMYADFLNMKKLIEKTGSDSKIHTEATISQLNILGERVNQLENKERINRTDMDEQISVLKQYIKADINAVDVIPDETDKKMTEEFELLKQQLFEVSGHLCNDEKINTIIQVEDKYSDGFTYFNNGNYREALKIFSEAVISYPDHEKILFHYTASLFYSDPRKRSNYPLLKEQLESLRVSRDYSRESLFLLAEIFLSDDKLVETARIYREILDIDENDTRALRSLGMIEFQLGNSVGASDYFSIYLADNTDDYEIVYCYGLSLFDQGLYKQALDQFYLSLQAENLYGNLDGKIKETIEMLNESSDRGVKL